VMVNMPSLRAVPLQEPLVQVGTARFGHLESPLAPAPQSLAPFLSVRPHPVYHSLADHKGTGTSSVRLMLQPTRSLAGRRSAANSCERSEVGVSTQGCYGATWKPRHNLRGA
jgi:hypothetical protein